MEAVAPEVRLVQGSSEFGFRRDGHTDLRGPVEVSGSSRFCFNKFKLSLVARETVELAVEKLTDKFKNRVCQ